MPLSESEKSDTASEEHAPGEKSDKVAIRRLDQISLMTILPDELSSYTGTKTLPLRDLEIETIEPLQYLEKVSRVDLSKNHIKSVRVRK